MSSRRTTSFTPYLRRQSGREITRKNATSQPETNTAVYSRLDGGFLERSGSRNALFLGLTFSLKNKAPSRSRKKASKARPSSTTPIRRKREPRLWRELPDLEQITYHGEAMGSSLMMSLLLSDARQKEISIRGIAPLQQSIARQLRNAGYEDRHFIVVAAHSDDDLVHAHGLIAGTDNDRVALESVLRRACGKWSHSRGGRYQVDLQPVYDLVGAIRYLRDNERAFRHAFPAVKRTVSVSKGLKSLGRKLWEHRTTAPSL